jgi:hypothetical protein
MIRDWKRMAVKQTRFWEQPSSYSRKNLLGRTCREMTRTLWKEFHTDESIESDSFKPISDATVIDLACARLITSGQISDVKIANPLQVAPHFGHQSCPPIWINERMLAVSTHRSNGEIQLRRCFSDQCQILRAPIPKLYRRVTECGGFPHPFDKRPVSKDGLQAKRESHSASLE